MLALIWNDLVFFNDTATTEIDTYGHALTLHDALPISPQIRGDANPAPATPGVRLANGGIALNKWVIARSPSLIARSISSLVASVCPAETMTPRDVNSAIRPVATISGARVTSVFPAPSEESRFTARSSLLRIFDASCMHFFSMFRKGPSKIGS